MRCRKSSKVLGKVQLQIGRWEDISKNKKRLIPTFLTSYFSARPSTASAIKFWLFRARSDDGVGDTRRFRRYRRRHDGGAEAYSSSESHLGRSYSDGKKRSGASNQTVFPLFPKRRHGPPLSDKWRFHIRLVKVGLFGPLYYWWMDEVSSRAI